MKRLYGFGMIAAGMLAFGSTSQAAVVLSDNFEGTLVYNSSTNPTGWT